MSELTNEYISDARDRMTKSVEATVQNFASIRTGRANPHLLDRIVVDYHGAQLPLKQLATVNAPEARLLTVTPFDKNSMNEIEKSIRNSDLGLNPSNDGNILRLTIPEMTEELRREMVKQARHIGEEGRIGIRNVRRDVMHDLRELKTEGEIGEDDERRAEAELQKLTDEKIAELDGILKGKEAEIMEV